MKNPYDALGVARDADQATIRKAFKALARKHHPDVNKEPGAETRFKEVSGAYEVLGDEQKRALYDEFGEPSLQTGFDADKARAWKNMGGGFGGNGQRTTRNGHAGANYEDLFGGFGGFDRQPARGRGADIEGEVEVPFLDAARGGAVTVSFTRPASCGTCKGEGGTGRTPCKACKGSGRRTMRQFGLGAIVQCDECGGEGSVHAEECAICGGTGRVRDQRALKVDIPAGVRPGQVMRLRGQGGEGRKGGPAGDLLLTLRVGEHALLRRIDNDLEMDLPVSLAEAVGGATIEVPTLTGRVRVRVPPGSGNGRRMRLAGRGVQVASSPGDLYLVIRPQLPADTEPETLELARQLDARTEVDVRQGLVL